MCFAMFDTLLKRVALSVTMFLSVGPPGWCSGYKLGSREEGHKNKERSQESQ